VLLSLTSFNINSFNFPQFFFNRFQPSQPDGWREAHRNISLEPILVTVFPDDLEEFIKISPVEFELMPEEKTPVNILLDFKQSKSGLKKTDISIISRALEKQSFNAASGIKIPLSIYFDNGLFKWSGLLVFVVVFFSILLAFLLARLIFWRKKIYL